MTKEKKSKDLVPKKEAPVFKSLKEYTEAIRTINLTTGEMAWKIGKYLLEVQDAEKYREGGYEVMADYVQSELDCTWQVARNHMRFASLVSL